jgi:hypothetical protein
VRLRKKSCIESFGMVKNMLDKTISERAILLVTFHLLRDQNRNYSSAS